ncbi:MAG: hypothetical protein JST26_08835 [Bacteroidetes bacterium]|nr:hypothetical protein [Bacteroidota bacterium]
MNTNRIDTSNYEAFLLDYAEGTLSAEITAELILFLAQHPELAVDLDELKELTVVADDVRFDGKQQLKRTEADLVSEEQMVAYIEGQLSDIEKNSIEKSISGNPVLQRELELYKRTVMVPDLSLVFDAKDDLKRKNRVVWLYASATRYAAAAALLLLLGLSALWISQRNTSDVPALAVTTVKHQPVSPAHAIVNPDQEQRNIDPTNEKQPLSSGNENLIAKSEHHTHVPGTNNLPEHIEKENVNENAPEALATSTNTNSQQNQAPVVNHPETNQPVNTLALNAPSKAQPLTVIESDDDDEAKAPKKNNLWAMAGKALKNLNKAGVKTVDGNERDQPGSTAYSLTLGGFQVTHSQKP